MSQHLKRTLSNHSVLNQNHDMIIESKTIRSVTYDDRMEFEKWRATIFYAFATLTDTSWCDSSPLIGIELISAVTSRLFKYLHKYLSLLDREMQIKKETITDSKRVKTGDILFTPNLKHVIVKDVRASNTNNSQDRISVEIVHATNHLFFSKKVSKSTFVLIPQTSVVAVQKKHNQYEKDISIVHTALRNVGKVLLSRSSDCYGLLPSISDLIGSMMYRREIYRTNDINPGDIILFLYHGLFQKGVILSKQQAPNNILEVTLYCIDEVGCVSESNSIYNLDKEIITRYAYNDLDSVIRKRVIYTAEQMKGMCLFRGLVQKSLRFVLGCMSGDLTYTQHQPIFIGLQEIKLKTSACPRIENIERWMKSNRCDKIPETIKENVPALHLCPTILVLTSTDGETEPALLFEDKHIIDTKIETFSSPSRAEERIRHRSNVCQTRAEPIYVVCMLATDEHGDLTKQDMTLIDLLMETTKDCADILFVIPKAQHSLSDDKRRIVSNSIEKQFKRATLTDKIYCNVFFSNDTDIGKRIALFAEEQLYIAVRELNKAINRTHGEMPLNGNLQQTFIDEYEKKMKKLESFFPSDKTDHYACHKLEVLLQRHSDVSAFSLNDGQMQIFTEEEKSVCCYIEEFLPKNVCPFTVRQWSGNPKISKYHVKQGSKVSRSNDHSREYGTLGFFLRDSEGSLYFSTCAHVIQNNKEVYTDTVESAVGKSIMAPNVYADSITEGLDLSLIKVFKEKIEHCRYGLRDSTDKFVTGIVALANDSEMKNMKVYKWGAKTELTKGIYKGSIFVREGEEFKNRIHFIQNNPTNEEFAEEGDSGSLICFEATDSPQLSSESAAFIFVGKCLSGKEFFPEEFKEKDLFAGLGYHVSNVFECKTRNLNPMLTPGNDNGSVQQGAGIQF